MLVVLVLSIGTFLFVSSGEAWAQKPSAKDANKQSSTPLSNGSRDDSTNGRGVEGNTPGDTTTTDPIAVTPPPEQTPRPPIQTSPPPPEQTPPPIDGGTTPPPPTQTPPSSSPPSNQKPPSAQKPPPTENYDPQPNPGTRYYYYEYGPYYEYEPASYEEEDPESPSAISYRYSSSEMTSGVVAPNSESTLPGGDGGAEWAPAWAPEGEVAAPPDQGGSMFPAAPSSLASASEPGALSEQSKPLLAELLPAALQPASIPFRENGSTPTTGTSILPSPFAARQSEQVASPMSGVVWNPQSNLGTQLSSMYSAVQSAANTITKDLTRWFSSPPSSTKEMRGTSQAQQSPAPQQQPPHDPIVPIGGSFFSSLLGSSGQAGAGGGGSAPVVIGILAMGLVLLYGGGKLLKAFCEVLKMSSTLLTPLERPG